MPQHGTQICKGMSSWYQYPHANASPSGILLIGTSWVPTKSISISINPTSHMNNVKVILSQDKC